MHVYLQLRIYVVPMCYLNVEMCNLKKIYYLYINLFRKFPHIIRFCSVFSDHDNKLHVYRYNIDYSYCNTCNLDNSTSTVDSIQYSCCRLLLYLYTGIVFGICIPVIPCAIQI